MLKELCLLNGTSGDEKVVREYIIKEIEGYCDYSIDALGSIIAFKKGSKKIKKTVSFNAHMDEVGFIITNITEDGYLKFKPVGGIDSRVVLNRKLKINDIYGVVGDKAFHLLKDEERNLIPKFDNLLIDIGVNSKDEALNFVKPGDFAYFVSDFEEFGNEYIKSKALDDRIGCYLLIKLLRSDLPFDSYFCFNVQEEVGLRGSQCTVYETKPDLSFVIESTTASDICGIDKSNQMCNVEFGPVLSFMDNRTIYDRKLINYVSDLAKLNKINCQFKRGVAGGNDAGSIQRYGGATKVLAISLPCRYIHSPSSVVSKNDIKETYNLLSLIMENLDDIENKCF